MAERVVMKQIRQQTSKFVILSLLGTSLFSVNTSHANQLQCHHVFSFSEIHTSIDKTIHDLSALRIELDLAKSRGDGKILWDKMNHEYVEKEEALIDHLESKNVMTRGQIIERIRLEIARLQDQKVKMDEKNKQEEIQRRLDQTGIVQKDFIDGKKLVFHKIEAGSYTINTNLINRQVVLTKPYEMMATLTTQLMWRQVAELANQRFKDRFPISLDHAAHKGDLHPIESVSFADIGVWIKALNDLSQAGEPKLAEIIVGHKKGDIYRLPTEAEWEFVFTKSDWFLWRTTSRRYVNEITEKLKEYAWFKGNTSKPETQPVAQKEPFMVEGKLFYDLLGNVWEISQDKYQSSRPEGTDPRGTRAGTQYVVTGGHYYMDSTQMDGLPRFYREKWQRSRDTGFRLVRDVQ